MTREEAILLSAYTGFLLAPDFSEVHKFCEDTLGRPIWTHEFADRCVQKEIQAKLRPQIMELVQNISALRPVSREQVEKVWSGCEYCTGDVDDRPYLDSKRLYLDENGILTDEIENIDILRLNFCPVRGKPLTDEAVDIMLKRMEALLND